MTYYEQEIKRIYREITPNQAQLDSIIATRRYIENNYDQDLSLDSLSKARFISKYHLQRLFKRYYGQTPLQYLTSKRIEKAKENLKKGMTVTETCFAVGFKSLGSFSSLFKRRTGLSPVEFQKSKIQEAS